MCGNKSDMNQTPANASVVRAERSDTPWRCESYIIENVMIVQFYRRSDARRLLHLRLQMPLIFWAAIRMLHNLQL